jgi:hypothetical protein
MNVEDLPLLSEDEEVSTVGCFYNITSPSHYCRAQEEFEEAIESAKKTRKKGMIGKLKYKPDVARKDQGLLP